MSDPLERILEFKGICKRFSDTPVLRNVSFTVARGQTVGLVGENGAGKSTLMNILGGNLNPDEGGMLWMGQHYAPRHPQEAAKAGIAFIHQELNLFSNLSIAENIFLTAFPKAGVWPVIDRKTLLAKTLSYLQQVGLDLRPDLLVENLSAGERQLVEVAKALSLAPRLIIFDEPTSSLSTRETARLFALLQQLRAQGIAMIYISHTLGDVLELCEQIVVLRDGEVVAQAPAAEFTEEQLISHMVGRNLTQIFPERKYRAGGELLLEVKGLTQPGIVRDVRFEVRSGEIIGIYGLMGAGRSELARLLFGLDSCEQGEVRLAGVTITSDSSRHRIQQGLAFLTENRREEGLCMEAAIAENITLVSLREHARTPLRILDFPRLRERLHQIRQAVRLTSSATDEQPVKTLSGGNQQKAVLAKWLLAKPRVLILDEPTRGIDVRAKFEIYELINNLAAQGTGTLMISSELEELLGLCDRILVMCQGEMRAEFPRNHFDRERIMQAALPDIKKEGSAA